jgi:hypothetical protein
VFTLRRHVVLAILAVHDTCTAPLCATTNRAKDAAGWRAHQHPDGRRTWTHPRTGLTLTTIPTTWRPPPTGPP